MTKIIGIVDLIIAILTLILLVASHGGIGGSDPVHLLNVGVAWVIGLIALGILFLIAPKIGNILPLILTLILPFWVVGAFFLPPTRITPGLDFLILILGIFIFSGNILWGVWLLNLIAALKLNKKSQLQSSLPKTN